jgi:hypothetical protein
MWIFFKSNRRAYLDRTAIANRILSTLGEMNRMQNALYALQVTDPNRYPENYEILSFDIALQGERITCGLRSLFYQTANVKRDAYLERAAQEHNIQITKQDSVLEIRLPALLPKKRQCQGKFLLDPLYHAFGSYVAEHSDSIYGECVVYIAHIFNKSADQKRYRDYDNVETKQVIDAVAAFFLIDDSSRFIDVHNAAEFGETDCTAVYLVEKNAFPEWLKSHLSTVQTVSQNE